MLKATEVETDKMAALATAANEARGLAMDSIAAAHSGHMGLPLGAAEIGASLYGSQVNTAMVLSSVGEYSVGAFFPFSSVDEKLNKCFPVIRFDDVSWTGR